MGKSTPERGPWLQDLTGLPGIDSLFLKTVEGRWTRLVEGLEQGFVKVVAVEINLK